MHRSWTADRPPFCKMKPQFLNCGTGTPGGYDGSHQRVRVQNSVMADGKKVKNYICTEGHLKNDNNYPRPTLKRDPEPFFL